MLNDGVVRLSEVWVCWVGGRGNKQGREVSQSCFLAGLIFLSRVWVFFAGFFGCFLVLFGFLDFFSFKLRI